MSRREILAVAFWLLAGFVAWNAAFDLLISRGIREYLYQEAQARLGLLPPVAVDEVMAGTVRYALPIATAWGLAVAAAGVGTVWWLRAGRSPETAAPAER
jgi:hypothetical protein